MCNTDIIVTYNSKRNLQVYETREDLRMRMKSSKNKNQAKNIGEGKKEQNETKTI